MNGTRGLQIGIAVAVAAAGIGLILGVQGTGQSVRRYVSPQVPVAATAPASRSYLDMRKGMHGPNAVAQLGSWEMLGHADLFVPVVQTEADRQAALARRASRRAYDGAPPTIPHTIDQLAMPSCLTCHEKGATIAGVIAPPMSHEVKPNCVQCHVVANDPRPGGTTPPAPESTFVGLASPTGGARAWNGAPPTIPHRTFMREQCSSCHGVFGANGMKSTHVWRASCVQCHAPSAVLDQRTPVAGLGGTP